jgi:RNA polymerase sigma-70 factor (ECF subfamily)
MLLMMDIPADPHPDVDTAGPSASQTDWSMIFQAAHGDSEPAAEAWDTLARRYWPAIYAYVRSGGCDVHRAADLTQGFICDVMVGRRLLEAADPERGRFRMLLLTALKNYLVERHRHASRRRRMPAGAAAIDPDRLDPRLISQAEQRTPEQAFAMQWSATLIKRVLDRLHDDCVEIELTPHWAVFEARVVRPMLFGESPTEYAALVDRLGLRDAAQAANMMITIKRRFAKALVNEVRQTLAHPSDVEDELHALLRALERPQ